MIDSLFGLDGQVAVVTGATGALGGAVARTLASAGARVALLARHSGRLDALADELKSGDAEALSLPADVLDEDQLAAARDQVLATWNQIDILVNAAGGNVPAATAGPGRSFFDLSRAALEEVIDLNLLGTILPCQVFGAAMAERGEGCIVNISSMAAHRALTRVVGYGAAKAAVEALTRWLAVELPRTCGAGLRVNAVVPGFFLGEQNRALLLQPDGELTPRGREIIAHTPAGRFGEPDDLAATLLWLCSPGARFVNGVSVAVDGGFDAFSGV